MGLGIDSRAVLIGGVLMGGAIIGLVNTLLTEALMRVAPDIERPVASAAYSFVRFGGGALAPWLAGKLSEGGGERLPFLVAAVVVLAATAPLLLGRSLVRHVDADEAAADAAPAIAPARVEAPAPLLLAVDGSGAAEAVTAEAARVARLRGRPVHVVHVQEVDVIGDDAVERESAEAAHATLRARLTQLRHAGVEAGGEVLAATGTHADVARVIARRATDADAALIVVGRGEAGAEMAGAAPTNVLVVGPASRPVAAAA